MDNKKIAVVTGANRGIGFEICRQLAKNGFHVVLTARDTTKGKDATKKLEEEGSLVVFHKLDVTSVKDAQKLANFLKQNFGTVDVLVNNAGVYLDKNGNIFETDLDVVKNTFETNLYGSLIVSQALFSLMKKGSRIINVSSHSGQINGRFGFAFSGLAPIYGVSKLALNGLTMKLAANKKGVKVNAVAPGWVRTDMGGSFALRSVKKGAETVIWLTVEKSIPNGKFFADKKIIEW